MRIGVLSDTHGVVSQAVLDALEDAGVDRILHAGDYGNAPAQIAVLEAVAPTIAVRGNNDWDSAFPKSVQLDFEGVRIYMAHTPRDVLRAMADDSSGKPLLGIHGHTHVPKFEKQGRDVVANPGAPRYARGGRKTSIIIVDIEDETVRHRFIEV
jgi:putative phosphoesterase